MFGRIKKMFNGATNSPSLVAQRNLYYNNSIMSNSTLNDVANEIYSKRYQVYKNNDSVNKAINTIINYLVPIHIDLKQKDKKGDVQIISDNKLIKLLNNPNLLLEKTKIDFFRRTVEEFIINGSYYWLYDQTTMLNGIGSLHLITSNNVNIASLQINTNFPLSIGIQYNSTLITLQYDIIEGVYADHSKKYRLYAHRWIIGNLPLPNSLLSAVATKVKIFDETTTSILSCLQNGSNSSILTMSPAIGGS